MIQYQAYTVLTQADIKNYLRFWHRWAQRKAYFRMIFVLAVMFIALLTFTILWDGFSLAAFQKYSVFWGLFLGVVYVFYALHRIDAKRAQVLTKYSFLRIFRDDAIESILPDVYQRFEYAAVQSLCHQNHCWYLVMSVNTVIILPERSFTQGDPAAFGTFIAEKTGLEVKEIK